MVVICDTSPISGLLRIGQLDVLRLLYGKIFIPNAVCEELLELKSFGYDIKLFLSPPEWIEIPLPGHVNELEVMALQRFLDYGETEVIAWAKQYFYLQNEPTLVIIDEKKARSIAEKAGLSVIGLVGVLIEAKMAGFIPDVKTFLDQLIQKANFRISQQIYRRILEKVGE